MLASDSNTAPTGSLDRGWEGTLTCPVPIDILPDNRGAVPVNPPAIAPHARAPSTRHRNVNEQHDQSTARYLQASDNIATVLNHTSQERNIANLSSTLGHLATFMQATRGMNHAEGNVEQDIMALARNCMRRLDTFVNNDEEKQGDL